jgi:lysophospholipase L1-like esterase
MMIDPNSKPKIMAIGDSITKGYPDDYTWTKIASKKLDIPIDNMGEKGETFTGILMRLDKDVISKEPDFCIVTAGTNDLSLGYEIEDIKKSIKEIIIELEKEGILPIIGVPIPTIDEYIEKKLRVLRSWITAVCAHTIAFDKVFDFDNLLSGVMLSDGVHPTHEGHDRMAEAAVHELRKIIINLSR